MTGLLKFVSILVGGVVQLGCPSIVFGQSIEPLNFEACQRFSDLGKSQAVALFAAARKGTSGTGRCDTTALFESYLRARDATPATSTGNAFLDACFRRAMAFEAITLFNAEADACREEDRP